jgi:hypothetical protein
MLAAATAGVKPKFIELPRRGPITLPNTVVPPDRAAHAGMAAYSVITPFKMLPTEIPDDEDVKIPPSPPSPVVVVVVVDPVEDPPRSPLRIPDNPDVDDVDELGDTRLCSAVCIVDISCDSVDCAPVPVDVLAAWALCAANPPALVVCGAAVNGVTFAVAAAEFAA